MTCLAWSTAVFLPLDQLIVWVVQTIVPFLRHKTAAIRPTAAVPAQLPAAVLQWRSVPQQLPVLQQLPAPRQLPAPQQLPAPPTFIKLLYRPVLQLLPPVAT
jgi:hypothetical protein